MSPVDFQHINHFQNKGKVMAFDKSKIVWGNREYRIVTALRDGEVVEFDGVELVEDDEAA